MWFLAAIFAYVITDDLFWAFIVAVIVMAMEDDE